MYKLLLLLFFTTTILTAQEKPFEIMDKNLTKSYPFAYAALGNIIYDNAPKIEKLKEIDQYTIFKDKIEKYIQNVKKTMEDGFALNLDSSDDERKKYLNKLRALVITNDFFVRSVDDKFNMALEKNNTKLFSELLESGLVDIQKYKDEILKYYHEHEEEITPQGILLKLLDEEAKSKAKKKTIKSYYKTKRQRELERIREIRAKDKKEQEKLEKQLQKELEQKKLEIREYQKEELSKTK